MSIDNRNFGHVPVTSHQTSNMEVAYILPSMVLFTKYFLYLAQRVQWLRLFAHTRDVWFSHLNRVVSKSMRVLLFVLV